MIESIGESLPLQGLQSFQKYLPIGILRYDIPYCADLRFSMRKHETAEYSDIFGL